MKVTINVPECHLKKAAFALSLLDSKNELTQETIEQFLATEEMEFDTKMFDSEEKENEFFMGLCFALLGSSLVKNHPKT